MAKLHVITYGCQMNEYDSERVAGLLREHRYELTDSESDADLILVNTCAIREKAEEKVFSKLGELRALAGARARRHGLHGAAAAGDRAAPRPPRRPRLRLGGRLARG
jgi:tRNA-2-methylthio-N6-dimethylallyladenosine synthase